MVPQCVHWMVGSDQVHYDDNVSTKTADLTTAKLLFNSVVSTPMMGNLKDFYLGTPMLAKDYAYMHIPVAILPDKIIEHYNLCPLIHKGHIYVKICQGMYGLPQAGKLANIHLQNLLEPHGYHPCPITPGLWMHTTHDIQFTLVVNDLAIQYTAKADGEHLLKALKGHYQVTEDWVASWYCRLTLTWDYTHHTMGLTMPGYISCTLKWFQHPLPNHPEHSPHAWQKPS